MWLTVYKHMTRKNSENARNTFVDFTTIIPGCSCTSININRAYCHFTWTSMRMHVFQNILGCTWRFKGLHSRGFWNSEQKRTRSSIAEIVFRPFWIDFVAYYYQHLTLIGTFEWLLILANQTRARPVSPFFDTDKTG